MGLVYGLIRTFPFWGLPLGIFLILDSRRAAKRSSKRGLVALLLGFLLVGLSVLFFVYRGHETAVPFAHEILNSEAP